MARKKKKKIVTVAESTSIRYDGVVTIKKLKNGKITSSKTFHNQGYTPLFKFILRCLTGDLDKNELPGFCIGVIDSDDIQSFVGGSVPIAEKNLKLATDNSYYLEYKFLLPYNPVYNSGFDSLHIYPTDSNKHPRTQSEKVSDYENYLDMSISLNRKEIATNNEDILIIWQLKLSNPQ